MHKPTLPARKVLLVSAALLMVSWSLFFIVVAPADYKTGTSTFDGGLALTAFVLGMRHAFDADHIAAIDNTTRKLVDDRRDPSSVGAWFAFGHSSVVLLAVGLITAGVGAIATQVRDGNSLLLRFASIWGPSVSNIFLLTFAGVNLALLIEAIRRGRRGDPETAGALPRGLATHSLNRLA